MKKIFTLFASVACFTTLHATHINITTSGFTYSPATANAVVGDTITIAASTTHPLVQVDQATWNIPGNTAMSGGWGVKTTAYTFTVTVPGTIYFVCQNHYSMGMKGQIIVTAAAGLSATETLSNSIVVFPNPAKQNVQLSFQLAVSAKVKIKIIDITGKEIAILMEETNLGSGTHQIDYTIPESISNGTYMISMLYGDKKITQRLVIQK